jgi:uncharacterized membrane protein YbhN (UPF0104 family)
VARVRWGVAACPLDVLCRRTALAGASGGFVGPTLLLLPTILVALAVVLAESGLLGKAVARLGGERPAPLILAGVFAVAVPFAMTAAWRTVLVSRGERLRLGEACGCYGLGSLANAVLPAKLGEAVRIEAFARRLADPRRRLVACGASALLALATSGAFAFFLAAGAVEGALPAWALAPSLALVPAALCARSVAARAGTRGKLAPAFAALTLSFAAWARVVAWIATAVFARLAAIASVLVSLGVHRPLETAVVAVASQALGSVVPIAPGGAGIGAAAMALGLSRYGLDAETATAAALSFHVLETCAAALFGACGVVLLRRAPHSRHSRVQTRTVPGTQVAARADDDVLQRKRAGLERLALALCRALPAGAERAPTR